MRRVLACVVALCVAASAWAGDLDDAAKKRVREFVAQLASTSEETRKSAETGLAAMGLDALPTAVAASDKLKSDDAWAAFARAVAGMGPGAADAVEDLRGSWPKGSETRFVRLESDVNAAAGAAALAAMPDSPTDVSALIDATIRELSQRRYFSYSDPKIAALAALGRPAFGHCMRILRDRGTDALPGVENYKAPRIAKVVLVSIARPGDVPVVDALVRSGYPAAAYVLRDVATPEAGAVFVGAVRLGLDHDICSAIEKRAPDERVGRELAAWIAGKTDEERYLVGSAALAAGRAGAPEAAAPIEAFLGKTTEAMVRAQCCVGLARLGVATGVAGLVERLEDAAHPDAAHVAGIALNETSGREEYKGGYDEDVKGWRGNFADAAKTYRAWWDSVKDKAKFDPATRKWTY
jgi:hypothetical protein